MNGGLSRIEYDECFAKLFGVHSLLRRRPGAPRSWRQRLLRFFGLRVSYQ
jgi:hypothetical protein